MHNVTLLFLAIMSVFLLIISILACCASLMNPKLINKNQNTNILDHIEQIRNHNIEQSGHQVYDTEHRHAQVRPTMTVVEIHSVPEDHVRIL